ncbi:MAG: hypothetical protein JWQ09_4655, partial [Segetibacter sp.]|nr:hypothetical protein [Segetibacter sp.]
MIPVQIKLYDLFREELHLPDDKAAAFVAAIKEIAKLKFENGK